jgi:hypothetical protein
LQLLAKGKKRTQMQSTNSTGPRSTKTSKRFISAFTTLCLSASSQWFIFACMTFRAPRHRLLCMVAALLFSLSTVAHGFAMTQAALKMPSVAAPMSMQDHGAEHGMDCGGDGIAHANCVAMCATAVAILCEPVRIPLLSAVYDTAVAASLPLDGRGIPPEPHPPKRQL